MKKNILLVLLSAALLTGCELDLGFVKLGGNQNNGFQSEEKQNESNQNSQENHGNSEENQQQNNENQPKDDLTQEYTLKINTSGQDFRGIATQAGVQMDDKSYKDNADKLKDYFDSKLEYANLLTGLSCTKLNTAEWESVCYLCIGTGYHGNGNFAKGALSWTSGVKIYKVEIEAMAYAKDYGGGTFGVDSISHVLIDEDDHSLETEQAPVIQTFEKEFVDGVTNFTIHSTGSRVLLKSMTITWRA